MIRCMIVGELCLTNLQHDPTLTCEQPRKNKQKRFFALAVDIIDSDGVIQTNTVGFTSDLSSIYISVCCRIWRRVQDVQIQNPADKSIVQSCVFSSYLAGGFQHFPCLMLLSKAGSCKGFPTYGLTDHPSSPSQPISTQLRPAKAAKPASQADTPDIQSGPCNLVSLPPGGELLFRGGVLKIR